MRTTTPSRSASRRLVLTSLLSLPVSALLLAAPAAAAAGGPAAPKGAASSSSDAERGRAAAPGQEKKAEPAPAATQTSAPEQADPAPSTPAKVERTDGSGGGTSGTRSEPQPLSGADRGGNGANPGTECGHEYCSTRDGSASKNGSSTGAATGRPCAGCVGKADNKDPQGQASNGSDANNGYECDGNSGIGRTNPAHTGCRTLTGTTQPPVETCPAGTPAGGTMSNGCRVVETCPAGTPAGGTMSNGCTVVETCPAGTPAGGTMSNGCTAAGCPAGSPPGATTADGCTAPLTPPSTVRSTPVAVDVLADAAVRPGADPLVVPLTAASPQLVSGPPARSTVPTAAAQVRPAVLPFTGAQLLWLLPAALVALALGLALVGLGRTRGALTA